MPPSSASRRLGTLLLVVWLVTMSWSPAGGATVPSSVTPRPGPTLIDHAPGHAHPASQRRLERKARHRRPGFAWRGRRITYYEALPAKWHWSVATAVTQWNRVGGGIKFVRTAKPRKAKLRIGYGNTGRAAGLATIGRSRHASVRLSTAYRGKNAADALNRVEVMDIITHELGHVLGYGHTSARCSLMSPVLDVVGCGVLPAQRPGFYTCRTIDAHLAARFVRNYGGSLRRAAPWCLIAPLPSRLPGVQIDASNPEVTVTWRRPSYAPSGSLVAIRHWPAESCGRAPEWAIVEHAAVAAGSWQESAETASGDNCFQVQLVNRYGAGRSSVGARIQRVGAPAAAPGESQD